MGYSLKQLFDVLLKNPSTKIWVQIIRYFVSGGVAFAVDTGLLYALTEWGGLHYLVSTTISFLTGLVITYLFSILWVFDNRNLKNKYAEFSVFLIIGAVGLLLTNGFMWLFTDKLGLYYILSKIITTVLVFIWNFAAKKSLLFRNKPKNL
jgi:putative flippase GtrA